jgi:hypothetical protein
MPRVCKEKQPHVSVFWAKCGKVSMQDLVNFRPNHFVPLVEKNCLLPQISGMLTRVQYNSENLV